MISNRIHFLQLKGVPSAVSQIFVRGHYHAKCISIQDLLATRKILATLNFRKSHTLIVFFGKATHSTTRVLIKVFQRYRAGMR